MIQLSESVLLSKVDDEVVLLDADKSVYYGLNPVGSRMLELLTECGNLETAMRIAESEFDSAPERVRSDFLTLLDTLLKHELVQVHVP